jgi:hypothetical protein
MGKFWKYELYITFRPVTNLPLAPVSCRRVCHFIARMIYEVYCSKRSVSKAVSSIVIHMWFNA